MAATLVSTAGIRRDWTQLRSIRPATAVRLLQSKEVALALLVLIMLALLSGTLVPQRALTPSADYETWQNAHPSLAALAAAINLDRVYQSWWFLALLGVLFLSLLLTTVTRSRQIWKLDRVRHREGRGLPLWVTLPANHVAVPAAGHEADALDRAARVLAAAGYRVRRMDGGAASLWAEKGRYGVWGVVALHCSILVILLGGVYSGASKMSGYFELVEGQVFTDRHEGFVQVDEGPLFGQQYTGFQVRLDRLQTEYWENGTLREIASALTLRSPQGDLEQRTISVDRPLSYAGATIYQAKQHGFAALMTLKDAAGKPVTSGYVHFPTPKETTQPSTNRFPIARTSLRAEADFYPAPGSGPVAPGAWSQAELDQPWMYLFVRDEGDRLLYQGRVDEGADVPLGAHTLSFQKVARWTSFPMQRDPGIPVIFTGFALCAMGAAITYLWTPKRVWAWVQTDAAGVQRLRLGGRADKFQSAMQEEVADYAAQIGKGRARDA